MVDDPNQTLRRTISDMTKRQSHKWCGIVTCLVAMVCGLAAGQVLTAAEVSAFVSAMASIQAEDLTAHTDTLADDAFEGREAGTRGGKATANYLMKKLEGYGLKPGGDRGSYFQQFGSYRNVLAVLPGSDEELRDEYLVVGAHFDHVGYGSKKNSYGSGYIHNGADDNASGTAALLEIAEALTHLPEAPRRSILIAFWDAEEKGLLGSKHWVKNPTVPMEQVRFKINADMVGRMTDDKVIVYGSRTAAGLRNLVAHANHHSDLEVSYVWWINPRSDHYTFVKEKIPVLMLHTGLHNDYHRPSDDAHKLNATGMQRISQLMFSLTYELAESDSVPAWRKDGAWESSAQRKLFETAPAAKQPRLGITWDETPAEAYAEEPGLVVKSVLSRTQADIAGLLAGDRIIEFDDQQVTGGEQFRGLVLAAPRETSMVVMRKGEEYPLDVSLSGQPVQLGISWRENSAEPNTVTVVQVLPGSPADNAGIKRLDRIVAVDGESFADSAAFEALALPSGQAVKFQVERNGRLLTVNVTPNSKRD